MLCLVAPCTLFRLLHARTACERALTEKECTLHGLKGGGHRPVNIFKIFVHFDDFMSGDWYFPKDPKM